MRDSMNKMVYIVIGIAVGAVISFLVATTCGPESPPVVVSRDTLVVVKTDTVTVVKPEPCKIKIIDTVEVSMPCAHEPEMPRAHEPQLPQPLGRWLYAETTYHDEHYTAVIVGIGAYLKSIEIYPRTEIRTITTTSQVVKKTRWGVGVQLGAGFGKNGVQPYIGIGLSYNLICW